MPLLIDFTLQRRFERDCVRTPKVEVVDQDAFKQFVGYVERLPGKGRVENPTALLANGGYSVDDPHYFAGDWPVGIARHPISILSDGHAIARIFNATLRTPNWLAIFWVQRIGGKTCAYGYPERYPAFWQRIS